MTELTNSLAKNIHLGLKIVWVAYDPTYPSPSRGPLSKIELPQSFHKIPFSFTEATAQPAELQNIIMMVMMMLMLMMMLLLIVMMMMVML